MPLRAQRSNDRVFPFFPTTKSSNKAQICENLVCALSITTLYYLFKVIFMKKILYLFTLLFLGACGEIYKSESQLKDELKIKLSSNEGGNVMKALLSPSDYEKIIDCAAGKLAKKYKDSRGEFRISADEQMQTMQECSK